MFDYKSIISRILSSAFAVFYSLQWFSPFFWLSPKINRRSRVKPVADLWTLILYRLDILCIALTTKPSKLLRPIWQQRILDGKEDLSKRKTELKTFDWKKEDKSLLAAYLHCGEPVLIKGYISELESWQWESFMEKYGERDVQLTCPVYDGYRGKLKEVNIPGVYLQNSESLLNENIDLASKVDLAKLAERLLPNSFKFLFTQLFVGRKKTGSPFHCAAGYNAFVMLKVRKNGH